MSSIPPLKTILVVFLANVFLGFLSYTLSSFFAYAGDPVLIVEPPVWALTSFRLVPPSIDNFVYLFGYIFDWLGFFMDTLIFNDIPGLPTTLRLFIIIPLMIANAYIIFNIVVTIASGIGEALGILS